MAETVGRDLVKSIGASNYTTLVLRPARLAREVKGAVDWLTRMLVSSKGVSTDRLTDEMFKLMRSVDLFAATSDIQKDHAVSALVFKPAAPAEQGKN